MKFVARSDTPRTAEICGTERQKNSLRSSRTSFLALVRRDDGFFGRSGDLIVFVSWGCVAISSIRTFLRAIASAGVGIAIPYGFCVTYRTNGEGFECVQHERRMVGGLADRLEAWQVEKVGRCVRSKFIFEELGILCVEIEKDLGADRPEGFLYLFGEFIGKLIGHDEAELVFPRAEKDGFELLGRVGEEGVALVDIEVIRDAFGFPLVPPREGGLLELSGKEGADERVSVGVLEVNKEDFIVAHYLGDLEAVGSGKHGIQCLGGFVWP